MSEKEKKLTDEELESASGGARRPGAERELSEKELAQASGGANWKPKDPDERGRPRGYSGPGDTVPR